MRGTERAYDTMRCAVLSERMVLPGNPTVDANGTLCPANQSGTEIAYGPIGLRACYAVCGTEIAYAAAMRLRRV
eukprot:285825-Rhodomonas_salina.2